MTQIKITKIEGNKGEGLMIGTPVTFTYENGKISKVTVKNLVSEIF